MAATDKPMKQFVTCCPEEAQMHIEEFLRGIETDEMFEGFPYQKQLRAARQEGRKEGREEGREEGARATLRATILNVVRLRLQPTDDIIQILEAYLTTIQDTAKLNELLETAIQAETSTDITGLMHGSQNNLN